MNRRVFLRSTAASAASLLACHGWAAEEKARLSDDEILERATSGIEQHRKSAGTISVRDGRGKPVKGAKIRLQQLRHDFLFGCNLFAFARIGDADLEERYRSHFAAMFNYCTLGFYWAAYEPERGKPHYDYIDKVVEWTREHGIACKGHPLAWDHPVSSPRWLPDDPAEIERLSTGRVREIVSRYARRIDIWDVVNEATHLDNDPHKSKMADWAKSCGAVPYVAKHLRAAREGNPKATLLVNDYRTDPAYYRILEALRGIQNDSGPAGLFDTIGIQSHMHGGVWLLSKVRDICETYGRLDLPIHFTETTIVSGPRTGPGEKWRPSSTEGEARQAEQTARFYTTLFSHPAVRAITWWDFSDLGAWQGAAAGWLRKDMSPKPVYEQLKSLIKESWWTNAQGVTNSKGEFDTRAFFGTHRITAELPDGQIRTREVQWKRGEKNLFTI
jgi:GH35 family endo-1,4-beta-xylanase